MMDDKCVSHRDSSFIFGVALKQELYFYPMDIGWKICWIGW